MIQTNELRVGNWVKTTHSKMRGLPYKIIATSETDVSFNKLTNQFIWMSIDMIKPIRLTHEILDKCGFITGKGWYIKCLTLIESNGRYLLSSEDNETGFDYDEAVEVKYLHHFQNLYFALTGTELNINL